MQPGSSSSSGSGATGGQGGSNANAGGNGNLKRRFYQPGEVVVGARDAEDAIRRFREDGGRFVRPLVCFFFSFLLLYYFYCFLSVCLVFG